MDTTPDPAEPYVNTAADLARPAVGEGGGEPVKAADVLADYHIWQPSSDGADEHHYLTLEPAEAVAALSEAAGGGDFAVVDGVLYAVGGIEVASDHDGGPDDGVLVLLVAPVLGEATDGDEGART